MQTKRLKKLFGLIVLTGLGAFLIQSNAKDGSRTTLPVRSSTQTADFLLVGRTTDSSPRRATLAASSQLPLSFEPNQGQADPEVKFLSHQRGSVLLLTSTGVVLVPKISSQPASLPSDTLARGTALRMSFIQPSPKVEVTGEKPLPGKSNYFIGPDSAHWQTGVPQYGNVRYHNIYPGVDMVYYGQGQEFEFDFIVSPGSDPSRIQFAVDGVDCIGIDNSGNLALYNSASRSKLEHTFPRNCQQSHDVAEAPVVRLREPQVYQEIDGSRHKIAGRYVLHTENKVGFELSGFDPSKTLCIDPVLEYSTYLGGNDDDSAQGIAVDSNGNMYITGTTRSTNFPTSHPFQAAPASFIDAFVTKLNPAGDTLIYSTYLGGTNSDMAEAIAIDELGNAYIAGTTLSTDFPTASPFQPIYGGGFQDAFLAKLNPDGSALVYSTYLGGSGADLALGLFVDSAHNAYLTGQTDSTNFPTVNAVQSANGGGADAFVTKVNAAGSALLFSSYLGGNAADVGFGITADSQGNAYVTGRTNSPDFPVTSGALQTTYHGTGALGDAFVTKMSAMGSSLVFSTYLGGTGVETGSAIALDSQANVYVTGSTGSSDFPTTAGALKSTCGGGACDSVDTDAFVTKLNPSGSALIYSTYLGGRYADSGTAISVDSLGIVYVAGATKSSDFPTANPIQASCSGSAGALFECNADAFLVKLTPNGSNLIFSTYLGGGMDDFVQGMVAVPPSTAYLAGQTQSGNFPTVHPFQANFGGGILGDAFVLKMSNLALPFRALAPMNLTFGGQIVGTTSTAETITVTNEGDAPLSISSIAASAEYAETNNCGASVALSGNCSINVTFSPAATGFRAGTLTITDNASGSPLVLPLSGTGADFTVGATPASKTISAGQTANFNVSVTPQGGSIDSPIALTCSLPQSLTFASCTLTPSSVTPGANPGNSVLTITTTGPAMAKALPGQPLSALPLFATCLGFLVLGLVSTQRRELRIRGARVQFVVITLAGIAGILAACGGGSSAPVRTPMGTYTVTITGAAGSANHPATATLVVQ